jgi:hypothetical protein
LAPNVKLVRLLFQMIETIDVAVALQVSHRLARERCLDRTRFVTGNRYVILKWEDAASFEKPNSGAQGVDREERARCPRGR